MTFHEPTMGAIIGLFLTVPIVIGLRVLLAYICGKREKATERPQS